MIVEFLMSGGFKKVFEAELQNQINKEEENKLNRQKLIYDIKNSKRIFKTYWWTFGISIAAFLLALGKIIYDLLLKP